jgi:hypothetical protein|tara:strand:+ start:3553 stop:3900 length:348 start_codon:yes stop_codon:yes gene_type:complete
MWVNFNNPMAKIRSISVSQSTEKIFDEFDKVRPNNVSFSAMLGLAVKEYMEIHKTNDMRLDNFTDSNSIVPALLADITVWSDYINKTDMQKLTSINRRLIQLENLINIRQGVLLT